MSRDVRVRKMSGAGNDFVVIGPDAVRTLGETLVPWVRRVCRRGLSVGADGVLAVEPGEQGRVRVRFHNPDGSAAFCGNGTRCAARFARLEGFAGDSMVLDTIVGDVPAELLGDVVRPTLPPPNDRGPLELDLGGTVIEGRRIDAGVPHFVVFVDDVRAAPLERWGPPVRRHAAFGPEGTNLDLVRQHPAGLAIRTWERGVEAETLSCGSGALAAACALRGRGGGDTVRVIPAGGVPLLVRFPTGPGAPDKVALEGDARVVFEATLDPEATTGFSP